MSEQAQLTFVREDMRELSPIANDTKRAIGSFTPLNITPLEPVLKSWLTETSATVHRADMFDRQITISGYINDEDLDVAKQYGASISDDQRPGWKSYTMEIKDTIEP